MLQQGCIILLVFHLWRNIPHWNIQPCMPAPPTPYLAKKLRKTIEIGSCCSRGVLYCYYCEKIYTPEINNPACRHLPRPILQNHWVRQWVPSIGSSIGFLHEPIHRLMWEVCWLKYSQLEADILPLLCSNLVIFVFHSPIRESDTGWFFSLVPP